MKSISAKPRLQHEVRGKQGESLICMDERKARQLRLPPGYRSRYTRKTAHCMDSYDNRCLLLILRAKAAVESKKRLAAKKVALAKVHADEDKAIADRVAKERTRQLRKQMACSHAQGSQPACARSLHLSSDEEHCASSLAGNSSLQPPRSAERSTGRRRHSTGRMHAAAYSLSHEARRHREQGDIRMALRHAIKARRSINGMTVHDTRSIFASLDQDGSGALDMNELTLGLRRLGLGLTASQVNSLADVLDANEDGVVSIEELSAWLHSDTDTESSGAQVPAATVEQVGSQSANGAATPVKAQLRTATEGGSTPSYLRSPTPASVSKGMMHLKSDEHLSAAREAVIQMTHIAKEETKAAAKAARHAAREAEISRLKGEERRRKARFEQESLERKHREHLMQMEELEATLYKRQFIEKQREDAQRISANRQAQETERRWIATVNEVRCTLCGLSFVVSVCATSHRALSNHLICCGCRVFLAGDPRDCCRTPGEE